MSERREMKNCSEKYIKLKRFSDFRLGWSSAQLQLCWRSLWHWKCCCLSRVFCTAYSFLCCNWCECAVWDNERRQQHQSVSAAARGILRFFQVNSHFFYFAIQEREAPRLDDESTLIKLICKLIEVSHHREKRVSKTCCINFMLTHFTHCENYWMALGDVGRRVVGTAEESWVLSSVLTSMRL